VWVERSLIEAMGFALFAEMFYVTGEEVEFCGGIAVSGDGEVLVTVLSGNRRGKLGPSVCGTRCNNTACVERH
jgi:predicted house-cleaning NTP pyrophosphatase (Maf/HAM1 superfamily)